MSSLPANQARQENEEKNINKTHMAKSKIQNKVKKIIADRVRLPIDPYKRPGAPDYPPRFSSDKFKNLVQYSICVFFRSNMKYNLVLVLGEFERPDLSCHRYF